MSVLGWLSVVTGADAGGLFAFLPGIGPGEMLIVGVIAVLLFGSRLPEVGRSLGKSLIEFKKGLRGVEDEFRGVKRSIESATRPNYYSAESMRTASRGTAADEDRDEPTAPKFEAPKFEPPTSEPQAT